MEPHPVALVGGLRVVVERHARRGHDGVAALAGRDAPQLRGRAVRAGQHRRPAGLGQQHAARGDPVEAGGGVAPERQRARARGQAAARRRGRDGHGAVEGARQAVVAVVDRAGDRRVRQQPRLGGGPVGRVEPHPVALVGGLRVVVERHARRGHDGVAALAGRDAPQLRGRAVRAGQHRRPAGLGQQHAARRYAVEPRCGVALEGERRGPLRERAAGGGGGHGHALIKRGGQAVGPVVDDSSKAFFLYSAFRSYLALHLLFDSIVTLDATVRSILAPWTFHSLRFIA